MNMPHSWYQYKYPLLFKVKFRENKMNYLFWTER